jgi:hypothetical protein
MGDYNVKVEVTKYELILQGDYHTRVVMTETSSKEELLCLDTILTVKGSCSGLSCIFGK